MKIFKFRKQIPHFRAFKLSLRFLQAIIGAFARYSIKNCTGITFKAYRRLTRIDPEDKNPARL